MLILCVYYRCTVKIDIIKMVVTICLQTAAACTAIDSMDHWIPKYLSLFYVFRVYVPLCVGSSKAPPVP